ncbi:hypothetical protein CBL_11629 [Carabus blaptoides fortunei]
MESLGSDDDNTEVFKGGTLEIKQEQWRLSTETNPELVVNSTEVRDNDVNANIDSSRVWAGTQLIGIPKRITETLWNCKNNNTSGIVVNTGPAAGTATQLNDNARDYFTFRDDVVERAVQDCAAQVMNVELDGELIATYLLTEISLWDAEKERLVIVTSKSVISVKYDFIALKQLEHRRIPLDTLESIILGELVYPSGSLVPRLSGLASGVTNVMRGCLLERWSQHHSYIHTSLFQPRDRKMDGVRLMWNKGAPVAFTQRWNPFSTDIPYLTFTSHPLHRHPECLDDSVRSAMFSVAEFSRKVIDCVEQLRLHTAQQSTTAQVVNDTLPCVVQHKRIVLQTYVGLGSLIHNRNALGFFKVRGKFSF